MADKFSGRVYAGEDSEDDEEEEEIQYNFQFGGFSASQSSSSSTSTTPAFSLPAAPRFNVQAPAAAAGVDGSDEDEDDESDEGEQTALSVSTASTAKSITVSTPAAANGEESEEDESEEEVDGGEEKRVRVSLDDVQLEDSKQLHITTTESVDAPLPLPSAKKAAPSPVPVKAAPKAAVATAKPQKQKIEDDDAHWQLDGSIGDGIEVMGDAIVSRLQPSLDDSIHRIAELTESQEHLLHLLSTQNASICSSEQIKKVAIVMDKLPHYIRKIQDIKAAMTEVSASVEKMKKRAENLRVDAQSHAIKKENKRDSMSQWNKLYAARSTEVAANGSSQAE